MSIYIYTDIYIYEALHNTLRVVRPEALDSAVFSGPPPLPPGYPEAAWGVRAENLRISSSHVPKRAS